MSIVTSGIRGSKIGLELMLVALGALSTGLAGAQQNPGQPGAQPGQTGQPGFQQGRRGFGQGGARMPFATGQVTGGDPATGTIVIGSPFGGSQTIKVSPDTKMVALIQVQASSLKVGDHIQVQGMPTKMTANTITAGEMPDFLTAGIRGRGGPNGAAAGPGGNLPGAPAPATGAAANAQGGPQQPPAFASASGKVTSTEPLTIQLSDEISLVLTLGPNAKVMKLMPATINNIKMGDTIFAAGQAGDDGTFTATGVGINLQNMGGLPGMGRGGFGGRAFGPGGFGGPGAGFGGPGGRRGGRGNRGGGQNGQGNGAGDSGNP